jgi:hypothetical protein
MEKAMMRRSWASYFCQKMQRKAGFIANTLSRFKVPLGGALCCGD